MTDTTGFVSADSHVNEPPVAEQSSTPTARPSHSRDRGRRRRQLDPRAGRTSARQDDPVRRGTDARERPRASTGFGYISAIAEVGRIAEAGLGAVMIPTVATPDWNTPTGEVTVQVPVGSQV